MRVLFAAVAALAAVAAAVTEVPEPNMPYAPLIIDDFERLGDFPDMQVREGWFETSDSIFSQMTTSCAFEGNGGLMFRDDTVKTNADPYYGWAYCMDYCIEEWPQKVGVYVNSAEQRGKAYLGFWTSNEGSYSLVLDFTDCKNTLQFQDNWNWDFRVLAEIPLHHDADSLNAVVPDQWYYIEVEFVPNGKVVGNLFEVDSEDEELLFMDSLSVECGEPYGCGVSLRAHHDKCFDDILTCVPAESVGDPHFRGFDGSTYDMQGRAGAIYNVLSDYNLQVNSRYRAGCREHATLMSEFGIGYKHHQLHINTMRVRLDNDVVPADGSMIKLSSDDEYVQVLDDDHVVVVLNDYIMAMTFVKVRCGGKRIDMKVESRNVASRPHGVLGQTLRHELHDRSESAVWNHHGQGVIEGRHTDYEVTHLFASDFKYNQFGDAAAPPQRFQRQPIDAGRQMGARDVEVGEDFVVPE